MPNQERQIDVVALHHVVSVLRKDIAAGFSGINSAAMRTIADRIERSLGAPLMQETVLNGVAAADDIFRGSPSHRAGFNAGVAWTLQQWPNLPKLYATAEYIEPAQEPAEWRDVLQTLLDLWHGGHLQVRPEAAGHWEAAINAGEALVGTRAEHAPR